MNGEDTAMDELKAISAKIPEEVYKEMKSWQHINSELDYTISKDDGILR